MPDIQRFIAPVIMGAALIGAMVACTNDGLEGPERTTFDDVRHLSVAVDHGHVMVFGSGQVQGAIVDRWSNEASKFAEQRERNTGGELVIDTRCNDAQACRVRYDVAVERQTEVDAHIKDGTLQLSRLGRRLHAVVDSGDVVGRGLATPFADISVERGQARLEFVESPGTLRLRIGEDSEATVFLPEGQYRCDFDHDADSIMMEELDCYSHANSALRIDPPDATIRFEIGFDESSPFH